MAVIWVWVDDQREIHCDPDPCPLRDEPKNCQLHWKLKRDTKLAWDFLEDGGIAFDDDPNGEFSKIKRGSPDQYHAVSRNEEDRDFKYTVRLVSTGVNDAGSVIERDPTIRNGSSKDD